MSRYTDDGRKAGSYQTIMRETLQRCIYIYALLQRIDSSFSHQFPALNSVIHIVYLGVIGEIAFSDIKFT